jgi:lipopolysaccharide/colanic/teichoic acid biosynthesis glycosyltransferase
MNAQNDFLHRQAIGGQEPLTPVGNMEVWRVRCYIILAAADIIAITVAFLTANRIFIGTWSASHGTTMVTIVTPIYLWVAAINGSYNGIVLRDPRIGAFKAIRALCSAAAALLIIAYSFKVGAEFSRLVFWIGSISAIVLLIASRQVLGHMFLRVVGGSPFSTVVVIDGITWDAEPGSVVIDAGHIGFDPQTDDPVHYHELAKLIAHADRVLIACRDDRVVAWAHVLKSMAVDGEVVAPDVDRIGMIGSRRTLVVSAGPLHLRDRMIKRTFDVAVSLAALIVLSPLLLGIAIAIRLESPGPVMFRQQRIGRDNTLFMMLKFRSMYHDRSDASASVLTARDDARVTKMGQFIRRNSIDELPQLFNVLRGDMSIVGPRPHALSARAADQLYWEIDVRYRHRHAVKPGVTGLAQIRGYRGATVFKTDLTNRLSSDLEYLRDWSMGKDLWILFRTIFVLRHDNAF